MAEEPKNVEQDQKEEALADLNPKDADAVVGGVFDEDDDDDPKYD